MERTRRSTSISRRRMRSTITLTVSLEGLNLTDEANDQFTDTVADRVVVYTHTGRQFFLGARYKF